MAHHDGLPYERGTEVDPAGAASLPPPAETLPAPPPPSSGNGVPVRSEGDNAEARRQESARRHQEGLAEELRALLNRASRESASNTPDFILAEYMLSVLSAAEELVKARDRWYGIALRPGDVRRYPKPPSAW